MLLVAKRLLQSFAPKHWTSVCPSYVATNLNNHSGPGTAADGAIAIVKYTQIGEDGPTAGFFHKDGAYSW